MLIHPRRRLVSEKMYTCSKKFRKFNSYVLHSGPVDYYRRLDDKMLKTTYQNT